jgi:hypothetical protein
MKSREALLWMALFALAAMLIITHVHTGDRIGKVERELATLEARPCVCERQEPSYMNCGKGGGVKWCTVSWPEEKPVRK